MTSINLWVLIIVVAGALVALTLLVAGTNQRSEGQVRSKQRARREQREGRAAALRNDARR